MARYWLGLLALVSSFSAAPAQTLMAAADVLDTFPTSVSLSDARGVAVIPVPSRGGLWAGRGVLVAKGVAGWDEPAFVTIGGVRTGTHGPGDLVLVFRTRLSLARVVNGDGGIDRDVSAYVRHRGEFTEAPRAALEGAKLGRSSIFSFGGNSKEAAELKSKLAELTAPKTVPEVAHIPPGDWVRYTLENRDAVLSGLVAVGACLTALRRGKR